MTRVLVAGHLNNPWEGSFTNLRFKVQALGFSRVSGIILLEPHILGSKSWNSSETLETVVLEPESTTAYMPVQVHWVQLEAAGFCRVAHEDAGRHHKVFPEVWQPGANLNELMKWMFGMAWHGMEWNERQYTNSYANSLYIHTSIHAYMHT